jgi:hypothetical protein
MGFKGHSMETGAKREKENYTSFDSRKTNANNVIFSRTNTVPP